MIAYQLSIFAENKPGRLAAVTGVLSREGINIRATNIATIDTFGVINLIVDDPKRAREALTREGMVVKLREILAILIDDRPGGLDRLTQLMANEEININNAYGFVLESRKRAVFVVDTDQIEKTQQVLAKNDFQTLDTDGLSAL
ncbi:MAG: ACT domain-containing protein [Smithellaceae bacterium]|nr:ACT domain-containing protein [Smithellaceae bacterium]